MNSSARSSFDITVDILSFVLGSGRSLYREYITIRKKKEIGLRDNNREFEDRGGEIGVSKEQKDEVVECLVNFVKRVSSNEKPATPAEIAALPEIAKLLFDVRASSVS